MTDRDDEARLGGGYRAGSTSYLLGGGCTSDCNGHDQVAEAHRLLVGAVVNAPPSVRDRMFGLLAPGDLDTPIASDALEILRVLHNDEVTDTADVTEQFAETVNARRRAHRQGDPIPASYPVGPISCLANAYCDAAKLSEVGAVVMAMVYSGTGHRRALAEASDRLAQAARGQADDEDMSSVVAKLLPLVERYRAVAG